MRGTEVAHATMVWVTPVCGEHIPWKSSVGIPIYLKTSINRSTRKRNIYQSYIVILTERKSNWRPMSWFQNEQQELLWGFTSSLVFVQMRSQRPHIFPATPCVMPLTTSRRSLQRAIAPKPHAGNQIGSRICKLDTRKCRMQDCGAIVYIERHQAAQSSVYHHYLKHCWNF